VDTESPTLTRKLSESAKDGEKLLKRNLSGPGKGSIELESKDKSPLQKDKEKSPLKNTLARMSSSFSPSKLRKHKETEDDSPRK
jgi:hypothetical protein